MADSSDIVKITHSDLSSLDAPNEAFITDVNHLASYNWIEAPTPTIVVPGCPPLWSDPTGTRLLRPDSGPVYVDQNEARHPESPLEPLFRALQVERPSFDLDPVDLVSDRNNLRKLLTFIDPASSQNAYKPFHIVADKVGNTVLFCRQEKCVQEYIKRDNFRGFNREFEKANTTSSIQGSTGHHRIVNYRFGALNFVIRHEADGYARNDAMENDGHSQQEDDTGAGQIGPLNLHQLISPADSRLTVLVKGTVVPLESTLQIKTRASHKRLLMTEATAQLWLSQTPQLVQAYHTSGMFPVTRVDNVHAEIKEWEQKKQKQLRVLAALITKIISLVKEHGRISIKYEAGSSALAVTKSEGKSMLPEDIYQLWGPESQTGDEGEAPSQPESIDTGLVACAELTGIKIGATTFQVRLSKVPYLARFVQAQRLQTPDKADFQHDAIPLIDVALQGIELGYRKCFRSMGADPALYKMLCDTYDLLHVDVLEGANLNDIAVGIAAGMGDHDDQDKWGKKMARDSAFDLIYLMIQDDKAQDADLMYEIVLIVVSHPSTFTSKQRAAVRATYESYFSPDAEQQALLDQEALNG